MVKLDNAHGGRGSGETGQTVTAGAYTARGLPRHQRAIKYGDLVTLTTGGSQHTRTREHTEAPACLSRLTSRHALLPQPLRPSFIAQKGQTLPTGALKEAAVLSLLAEMPSGSPVTISPILYCL